MEGVTAQVGLLFEGIGLAFDLLGVFVIVAGTIIAGWRFAGRVRAQSSGSTGEAAHLTGTLRTSLGHTLLLGLEILVAADIIKTVALEPNFSSLGVLAGLVLIRTFLSWSLILEIEGRFPWQAQRPARGE